MVKLRPRQHPACPLHECGLFGAMLLDIFDNDASRENISGSESPLCGAEGFPGI
jgi:hypothetical protein